jgi:hypothetical protein
MLLSQTYHFYTMKGHLLHNTKTSEIPQLGQFFVICEVHMYLIPEFFINKNEYDI